MMLYLPHTTTSQITEALMAELSRFSGDAPRADDLTLVVVKRAG